MWTHFDIYKYVATLIPTPLRKPRLYAFIKVFVTHLKCVQDSVKYYIDTSRKRMLYNGQVFYLEKALNDRFFFKDREIYISEEAEPDINLTKKIEKRQIYLYKKNDDNIIYIKNNSEVIYTGEFIVNTPDFLKKYETEIYEVTRRYSPAGKKFKIRYYNYE